MKTTPICKSAIFFTLAVKCPTTENRNRRRFAKQIRFDVKKGAISPSTREVSKVTLAALRLPAGKAIPILSNLSLRFLPPSLDLALNDFKKKKEN